MTVGLKIRSIVVEVGPSRILTAFFSSIHCNLEGDKWGGEFPVLLNEFYSGTLPAESAAAALQELSAVDSKFKNLSPQKVVWDFEDLEMSRPDGVPYNDGANNLSEFFVTKTGHSLISVIESRIHYMIKKNRDMTIDTSHFKFLSPRKK